jgi:RND superfamily putative drug exporter
MEGSVPGSRCPHIARPDQQERQTTVFPRLARLIARRRHLVWAAWLLLTVVAGVFGGKVFDHLGETDGLRPDAESAVADRLADQIDPTGPVVVAVIDGREAYEKPLVDQVTAVAGRLEAIKGVVDVDTLYTSPGGAVSGDNMSTTAMVELVPGLAEEPLEDLQDQVIAELKTIDAPRVLVGGAELAEREFAQQSVDDLARGEGVALVVLLVVLLFVFGGLVAASLPLLVAVVSVPLTFLALLGLGKLVPVSEYSLNIVALFGLGLAVDYSLLIVARFREERAAGLDVEPATVRAVAVAGRTVAFSALIVAISLAGLLAFAEPLLRSMALAGAVVVLLAALAAVTLVPALLAMWGGRISPAKSRPDEHNPLYRLSLLAARNAGLVTTAAAGVLLLLAVPFMRANLEDSGSEALPRASESRQVEEILIERFGATVRPITVVMDVDDSGPGFLEFVNQANSLAGVRLVENRADLPEGKAIVDITPEGRAAGPEARAVVEDLRAIPTPFDKKVAGPAAEVLDYRASVATRLPVAMAVIALATLVLLFLMTGSVVIPVKALIMNLLSLGASLGVLVLIFQDGFLSGLLGFDPVGAVDLTTPVLIVIFTFGLSMDYEMFLLARIKEAWDQSGDNDRAVALGLARSGRVITAAAACIVVVFLGFATGQLLPLKALGVGMTVAVLLDVTVVRGLLVPAVMRLLGRWNWWAPAPLARFHARFGMREPTGGEDRPLVGADR